ncbi:hypothetical protein HNV12_02200 [Methanococcoides sp. SA1]|nr:hypothetical protein [Methanococcoides sp. SA1]
MKIRSDVEKEIENLPKLVELAGDDILIDSIKSIYIKDNNKVVDVIKKLHEENRDKIKRLVNFYEKFWKRAGDSYCEEMRSILDLDLEKKKTAHIITSLWVNIADVIGKENFFIVAEESQYYPLEFIFLHELTHLHYSDALGRLNLDEAGESPLMEGVAHLILFKSPIKKLFDDVKYSDIDFVKENPEFMGNLENIWNDRDSFESFLKRAIELNKKTSGVVIC